MDLQCCVPFIEMSDKTVLSQPWQADIYIYIFYKPQQRTDPSWVRARLVCLAPGEALFPSWGLWTRFLDQPWRLVLLSPFDTADLQKRSSWSTQTTPKQRQKMARMEMSTCLRAAVRLGLLFLRLALLRAILRWFMGWIRNSVRCAGYASIFSVTWERGNWYIRAKRWWAGEGRKRCI